MKTEEIAGHNVLQKSPTPARIKADFRSTITAARAITVSHRSGCIMPLKRKGRKEDCRRK